MHSIGRVIAGIDDSAKRINYLETVCRKYNFDTDAMRSVISRYYGSVRDAEAYKEREMELRREHKKQDAGDIPEYEAMLLTWFIDDKTLLDKLEIEEKDFTEGLCRVAFHEMKEQYEQTGEITSSDILLSLSDDKVTMQRNGDFSNTMVFSSGKRFEGIYHTPYGEMDMAVFTKEAACRIGNRDGSLHLHYQLQIQGNYASTNELHLEYHADPPEHSAEKFPKCSGSADTGSSIQKGIISSSTRGSGRWCPCRFTRSRQTPIWGSMSPSRRKAIFFWGRRPRTKRIPKTTGQSRRTSTFSMKARADLRSRSVTRRHRTQST